MLYPNEASTIFYPHLAGIGPKMKIVPDKFVRSVHVGSEDEVGLCASWASNNLYSSKKFHLFQLLAFDCILRVLELSYSFDGHDENSRCWIQ